MAQLRENLQAVVTTVMNSQVAEYVSNVCRIGANINFSRRSLLSVRTCVYREGQFGRLVRRSFVFRRLEGD